MKRLLFIVALVCAIFDASAEIKYLKTADFLVKVYDIRSYKPNQELIYLGDKPCLIDFSTTWCGWCRKQHPILEEISKQYAGDIYVYEVDAEKEPEIARFFGIRSYPTCLLCPVKGQPQMAQGYHEKSFWEMAVKQALLNQK